MVRSLPKTGWLLTRHEYVIGTFDSMLDICIRLGIQVDNDGWVLVDGKRSGPQYLIDFDGKIGDSNYFDSKYEVLRNWSTYHAKLPYGYRVYRILL